MIEDYPFNYRYDILPASASGTDLIPPFIYDIMKAIDTEKIFFSSKIALREKNENNLPELIAEEKILLRQVFKENLAGPKAEKIKRITKEYD